LQTNRKPKNAQSFHSFRQPQEAHKVDTTVLASRAVHRGTARFLAAAALVVAIAAPVSAARDGREAGDLRRRQAVLADRSTTALTHLSLLERRLAAARADLDGVRARAATLAHRRADVERRLELARANLRAAERGLAARLRAIYVAGEPEPLEVVLGARSLRDALTTLDGYALVAKHDRELIEQTRVARARLSLLRTALARRALALRRAEAAAAANAGALERMRAAKAAYLERLRSEQGLTAARIAALSRRARVAAASPATASSPATAPSGVPVAPAARTLTVVASGYTLRGATATGARTGWGVVAVDPAVIPLGTSLSIPGYGNGVAADVGAAVNGAEIDLWFPSERAALAWGRRVITITIGTAVDTVQPG
jgi:3D (Asp-Asp-Asp) domain-containing protein